MRRGRVVSSAVRMKAWMKSARMAASMRELVRKVRKGWRYFLGVALGLGDKSREDDRLDESLLRRGGPSGAYSWLLEQVPYVAPVSTLAFLGLGSRSILRTKSSATSCTNSF